MVKFYQDAIAPNDWKITPQEAMAIQEELRNKVVSKDDFEIVHKVAGLDVGFKNHGKVTRASVVVLSFPELDLLDSAVAHLPTTFPYVPGLLSFREVPAIMKALEQIEAIPDLLLCDGHGLAHPRRFGLACHLGLLCGLPSIGVAKSKLIGEHNTLGKNRGDWTALTIDNETVGALLRTRRDVKPVYVSVGHRINLVTAIDYVLRCTMKFRLPETTRLAHRLASD